MIVKPRISSYRIKRHFDRLEQASMTSFIDHSHWTLQLISLGEWAEMRRDRRLGHNDRPRYIAVDSRAQKVHLFPCPDEPAALHLKLSEEFEV